MDSENRVHGARLRDHGQSRYGAFPLRLGCTVGDKSDSVTIREIALPHESSGATAGTPAATGLLFRTRGPLACHLGNRAPPGVYNRSWYGDNANLGDVISLEDQLPDMFPNREWLNVKGAGSYRRATWAGETRRKTCAATFPDSSRGGGIG